MNSVRELPSHLINQIAAGEVVERPGSVVKELVENALDAGARRIEVTVVEGGTERIEVADDGHGMRPEDARLAIRRHATSKILHIEDLQRLTSFGFRGEALPSIAAVSRFELVTRTAENQAAIALRSEGSQDWQESPASASVGTRVTVRDLFFNIPARRKFLKSVATESAAISEALLGQALAAPAVSFTLTRDGKRVREYLHAPSREDRAANALPNEKLSPFHFARGSLAVEAFLSHPERARVGAQGLHLVVNRRAVRDRALARAVAFAYGSVLEGGKYPVGVLYLDLPEEVVDVNVHPQKLEVRFRDARSVFDEITRGPSPHPPSPFVVHRQVLPKRARRRDHPC
jgi:DNA mismatch repair protein MutL